MSSVLDLTLIPNFYILPDHVKAAPDKEKKPFPHNLLTGCGSPSHYRRSSLAAARESDSRMVGCSHLLFFLVNAFAACLDSETLLLVGIILEVYSLFLSSSFSASKKLLVFSPRILRLMQVVPMSFLATSFT